MHDIHLFLTKLTDYFDASNASADEIRLLFCNQLPHHLELSELINNLTEICTECRQTRESDVFDNTHDSWEYFSKIISIEHLIGFFTGLIEFASKNDSFQHKKLGISVCRTYVLLLTSPGAKIFGAFDPDLLRKVFKIFDILKNISSYNEYERVPLQMMLTMLLEDFQLYLKHVSFEDYEELHVQFVETIGAIMELHHEKGFLNKYSLEIQELCYTTLENTCLPIHNTDITASLSIVLNGTACLTRFNKPCFGSYAKPKYALITDWFIDMLKHYPRQTSDTLNCYIQAILTDSDITSNRDLLSRYLDICAQYDASMVRICGQSMCGFLQQLALSKESSHRTNCVELIWRMLMMNTKCDWELFRSELPKIPREINLLRILLQKVYDSNNVVAMKAINAFLKVAADGNILCKEIIKKCFYESHDEEEINETSEMDNINESADLIQTQNEAEKESDDKESGDIDQGNRTDDDCASDSGVSRKSTEAIDYTKSDEFKLLMKEVKQNILCAVKLQLKNLSALVGRVVVLLLEFLGSTTLNIDDILTSYELRQLFIDQSPLVRRQLVLSLDKILNARPTSEAAINTWIKITLDLANDIDPKVMEIVIESFKRNVFDKIEIYEQSPSLTHVYPWRLLKSKLNCHDSPDFRISVQKWMNRNLLNAKTLSKIETHLDTNNATEAWILLAIVAPNMQGHNPERVSKLLLSNLKYDMTNAVENCYIQLEVLSFWLQYLNNPSKNEIKRIMTETLETGSLRPRNINRTFGICYKLCAESGDRDRKHFIAKIRNKCESYIFANQNSMFVQNLCDDRFISYVYLYSEIGSILQSTLHPDIVNFFFSFLHVVGNKQVLTVQNDSMLPDKVNCVLSVLTGLSSFSQEICARFVPHLGKILRTIDNSEVSFTAIKCLGYLCKKNTAVVETIVPYILMKTQHHYSNIREFAMKTLAALILEDYLKFRGTLLIYILAGLLDQQREIKELAVELIMKYTLEKSDIFLRTCLVECPFVFNGCPCFGHGNSGLTRSGNILKGAAKREAREYIYKYLIRKIEPVYLYMYFGNFTRLQELLQKEPKLSSSGDYQAAIADFLFVCAEICIVNEKQKRNLEKIVKESHTADGLAINDENEAGSNENPSDKADGDSEKKGRGGKKNQPTLKQSLATVEKIVPSIAIVDSILRPMNETLFKPVLDKLCTNMCMHFESLIEYAQPREFWAPFLQSAKKPPTASSSKQPKKAPAKVAEVMQPPSTPSRGTQDSAPSKSSKPKENDSGHFTLEDDDDVSSKRSASQSSKPAKRCSSRASARSSSQASERSVSQTPKRGKKRLASIPSDDGSDNESVFSELSDATVSSKKRKNTQTGSTKRARTPATPKTPASRKASKR